MPALRRAKPNHCLPFARQKKRNDLCLGGSETRVAWRDMDLPRKLFKESVMKCSNPSCDRHIGLVSYRRWFSKQRYCSKNCRVAFLADLPKKSQQQERATTYVEWLFLQPIKEPPQRLTPSPIRITAR